MRDSNKHVAVFGGGIAGVSAALELANKGCQVTIYEQKEQLLRGSSDATPGRAGLGFHYVHAPTGLFYMRATIAVFRKYPECRLGRGNDDAHYLKHGLYALMKEEQDLDPENKAFASHHKPHEILQTYEKLRDGYRQLIQEDPENEIFGDPDNFFTLEEPEKYGNFIDATKVHTVVNTREELLDWKKYRMILMQAVREHPNITVVCCALISSPSYAYEINEHGRLEIGFKFKVNEQQASSGFVVNATWHGIETLDQQMGFIADKEDINRTNRLKAIVTIPVDAMNTYDKEIGVQQPSTMCVTGPHVMISFLPNNLAKLTCASVTNVGQSMAVSLEENLSKILEKKDSKQEQLDRTCSIVSGAARYFSPLLKVNVVGVVEEEKDIKVQKRDRNSVDITAGIKFGIIRTVGEADIYDPNSLITQRDETWVKTQSFGWIVAAAMKLLYGLQTGEEVAYQYGLHMEMLQKIENACDKSYSQVSSQIKNKNSFIAILAVAFTSSISWTEMISTGDISSCNKSFATVSDVVKKRIELHAAIQRTSSKLSAQDEKTQKESQVPIHPPDPTERRFKRQAGRPRRSRHNKTNKSTSIVPCVPTPSSPSGPSCVHF